MQRETLVCKQKINHNDRAWYGIDKHMNFKDFIHNLSRSFMHATLYKFTLKIVFSIGSGIFNKFQTIAIAQMNHKSNLPKS